MVPPGRQWAINHLAKRAVQTAYMKPKPPKPRNVFRGETSPTRRSDNADAILSSKRIGLADGATRIVTPLAVHQKPVGMPAGWQTDDRLPWSSLQFFQGDGLFLPRGELSGKLDGPGMRRHQGKGDLLLCAFLLCHKTPFAGDLRPANSSLRVPAGVVKREPGQINPWLLTGEHATNTVRFVRERKQFNN